MAKFENIRGVIFTLLFAAGLNSSLPAQINAFYNYCIFNTPQNEPFLETHLTITGKSLFAKKIEDKFQNSINIGVQIYKDTALVMAKKYNLNGPLFDNATSAPAFIDNQRYPLPNGSYHIELTLTDNHNPGKKALVIKDNFEIRFNSLLIQSSCIQALESFNKAITAGPLTKSGYDLVPYTVNYYPETSSHLSFYMESYNLNKALGENKMFVYSYYIENAGDGNKLGNYGAFKKQIAAQVNPLLAKLDISKLGTGDYNLVIEVKDENNILQTRNKYFFQRVNKMVDIASLQHLGEVQNAAEYFGHVTDPDTLKMFVECLWPIADGVDKERIINQAIKKDPEMMKKFVVDFWQRRAADTANPVKMWATYYKSVQDVMVLFKCGKQKGYYGDRGRVYLQYGPPSQRSVQTNEHNTYPYEIWQYYRTTDATNGQFFSNRKFVFVNKMLGDDCYMLIHSDMRGEPNNPRWQFELTRRNNNGMANPDNNTPAGTEFNQFNDIYSNPR